MVSTVANFTITKVQDLEQSNMILRAVLHAPEEVIIGALVSTL